MRNTRSDVVAAALRVLDEQGLESCSMRRIAADLDIQVSALYHHVPNKQSLLALMADEIVQGVGDNSVDAAAGSEDRRAAAGQICTQLRAAMLSVRDGADVVATASAFRLGVSSVEAQLAGLVGEVGARTLLLFSFGHAQSTQTHEQAVAFGVIAEGAASGADPDFAHRGDATLEHTFDAGLQIILVGLDSVGAKQRGK